MLNFFGGNKDPNDFGVGVIGLQGTGRTHLIDKLTTNIFPKSSKKLSFHEIDYPDKGFGRTDQTAYNNYIGKMKKQHNLSLILLVVPGSFRDKEAVLVFASKYHALSVAVVMTKFDDSLRNINQETKQFTSTEKAEYKAKEQSYVIQTLLQYKNDANIHVFHVSIPCFSMPLKDKWKPFYQDEKMLCDFVTNCVDGNPNMPLQYHSPTHQCINNSAISPDLPDSYDIALVGVTNSGLIVARKALQKMFENISIQKLEYSHENAKFIVG
uniref:G domain-containing protein n=1 Tax=Panagrolaimus sp. ES5 TaxID=591445 RepID=A0AC34FZK7_9BILA